jgi:methionyl-tRNA formyltransferase
MPLRIVFMGSPEFAVPALEALQSSDHEIVTVISGADRRRGRGLDLMPSPVKAAAQRLGLPTLDWEELRAAPSPKEYMDAHYGPIDLFVVVAFKILSSQMLAIPRIGSVNIHASLLPAYRGAAPIHHTVMNGEKRTGCTIFFLDQGIDTGEVIMQEAINIGEDETTGEVYERLRQLGAGMIVEAVDAIEKGAITRIAQDHSGASAAPKVFEKDQIIDFNRDSLVVHNHIRGMSPFPCAFTSLDGLRFRIYRTRNAPKVQGEVGKTFEEDGKYYMGCQSGSVELVEVQLEGKRRMGAVEFFKGYRGRTEDGGRQTEERKKEKEEEEES